jgi:two-component system, cell cycle sensor histidine kinase and response regulator CckA
MTFAARAYIAGMIAVGGTALAHGLRLWDPADLPRFICYAFLAVPAACLKVTLPGVTGTMSVLFVFLLAAISELGLSEALVIGATCVTVQCFWQARVRPRLIQILFSVANVAFAIEATDFFYHWPVIQSLGAPFRLAIAASVFFVTNTFPVAAVIALTEGKSLRSVWSSCHLWCFPYYLVGAAIVGAFSFANRMLDWQAGVLIIPVVYVIYRSYRLYLGQLQTEREQVEQERKHAEEIAALHAHTMEALASATSAHARADAVLRASPLAILALDRGGNVTSWNRSAEVIFGWSPEETIGQRLPFLHDGPETTIQTLVDQTFRGESISGVEVRQLRRDGTPFDAATWTALLRDGAADISGILITVADASDRKRLEDQLRVSQKMEAVGRLAGGIAHDFNNLLTVINGYSTMLLNSVRGNSYAVAQAQEILGAGTRAAELVSQLLTFSRRQLIKPKPLDINVLVHDVERMLRRIIGEHIELQTRLDPDAGWIHADRNQMEGVLLNLATNARDAMPDGGALMIDTEHIEIRAERQSPQPELAPGSYVRLMIRDTGRGMDPDTQQHLFEPFFTTKQQGKGTGLGMSSVYGSVEQNHGRIFLETALGKGTAFSIYLPRREALVFDESQAVPDRAFTQGVETILLVEDEDAVRRMLREVLTSAGYRVLEAGHGADAINQWGSHLRGIDLLVTDIVMPVMNGLRLAEELRNRRPNLKVIFMSGHAEEVINQQSGPNPTPEILQKPFVPDVLVRKVREILDTPRTGSGLNPKGLPLHVSGLDSQ